MDNIASVIISNSTREFDKEYHYLIPDNMKGIIKSGMRVIVPFGKANTLREAFVFRTFESNEAMGLTGLKYIKKLIDKTPALGENMINMAIWMKERYICTYYDAIKCMLPSGTKVKTYKIVKLEGSSNTDEIQVNNNKILTDENIYKNIDKNEELIIKTLAQSGNQCEMEELKGIINIKNISRYIKKLSDKGLICIQEGYTARVREKFVKAAYAAIPAEEIAEIIDSNRIKRIQQIKVLEILMENEYVAVQDIVRFAGVSQGVLDTLKKYGYIDFREIEIKRDPFANREYKRTEPLKPTLEQEAALKILKEQKDRQLFAEDLLYGVTGSGKTEVYLQLIQYALDKGEEAIVLVPEISLTPQMVERFKGRFGNQVAVLHSRLSLGERYDQWRLIKDGKIKVVIGARSAIFAPLANIGLIIIDEEHEASYKSEITPKYHAADIARYICKHRNAVLLLGSATPSVETYYKAVNGEIGLINMEERANNMTMPHVEIIDMREELNQGNRSVFSRKLAVEIDKNIAGAEQTIILLNRRGYSPFVLCRSCGYVAKCINCSITMTYHAVGERLTCHYCGYTIKVPEKCPKCGSGYIRHFGTGTQKLEEETKKQFPGASVIRMDMDTTGYKNSHEEILGKFRDKNINIMVGTQMVAKGHDFPNVTLVGVLAADSILNIGDYRASERTFQLLTQVAGRAGRGELPGRVVIQAYNTDDFSILAASRHDFISFYSKEIKIRREMSYPPFTNIATAVLSGRYDKNVFECSKRFEDILNSLFIYYEIHKDSYEILGSMRPPIGKIKNKFRWRIVIKSTDINTLVRVLSGASDEYYKLKYKEKAQLSIDINPVSML
ncbi:MAG TPA: primosomal protein N' [Clostridiales bacterium]|nr:primosomal protein N' [Clostridiales bacterium]